MKNNQFISFFIIAVALFSIGFFTSKGMKRFGAENRIVSVKGVSERDVEADMAYWTIRHVAKDQNLEKAKVKLKESQNTVRIFLKKFGIKDDEIKVKRIEVQENTVPNEFGQYTKTSFSLIENLLIRTNQTKLIEQASQEVSELIDKGVFIDGGYNADFEPVYDFTKLNDFKPEMIAEATKSAREAAQQFANDSKSKIGNIKNADQGYFQILGRDKVFSISEHSQREKTLRVVVKLDYYLE